MVIEEPALVSVASTLVRSDANDSTLGFISNIVAIMIICISNPVVASRAALRAALGHLHGERVLVVSEADVLSKIALVGTVINNTLGLIDVSKSIVRPTQSAYIMDVTIIAIAT